MSRLYDVAVSIINYNSSSHTLACVESIHTHTRPELGLQILVIDNASHPDDRRALEPLRVHGDVIVVRSDRNLGFAGGHMKLFELCKARYFFILNNDCVLLNDAIGRLVDFCDSREDVGVCAPRLHAADGTPVAGYDYLPSLAVRFLGAGLMRLLRPGQYRKRRADFDEPRAVDVVTGSALFCPSGRFRQIGGLDTNFFLYCEEEDLALRLHGAGLKRYLVPAAKVKHHGGGSTRHSMEIEREFYISFLYLYRKHYGPLRTRVLQLYLAVKLWRRARRRPELKGLASFVLKGAPMSESLRHRQ